MLGERIRFEREIGDLGLGFRLAREFDQAQPKSKPKAKAKPTADPPPPLCPRTVKIGRRKLVIGGLRFTKGAKADLLQFRSLLDGEDRKRIGWYKDQLGYDPAYTKPEDPFRWDKLKAIIDSCARILIHKVKLAAPLNVLRIDIDPQTSRRRERKDTASLLSLGGNGLTLVTEAMDRAIYPALVDRVVSPDADVHAYYTTDGNSKDQNALAHELFGHVWLALQKAPYVHPNVPAITNLIGTLAPSHNILDPFGNAFAGTVRDFIARFIDRTLSTTRNNSTRNVGPAQYAQKLDAFKKLFASDSKGTLNGRWSVTPRLMDIWEALGRNFAAAPPTNAGGISQASIEADLTAFYGTLATDPQYVLLKLAEDSAANLLKVGGLGARLFSALTPPAGMNMQPPPPQPGFGGSRSTP